MHGAAKPWMSFYSFTVKDAWGVVPTIRRNHDKVETERRSPLCESSVGKEFDDRFKTSTKQFNCYVTANSYADKFSALPSRTVYISFLKLI
jgi:hypothetical protein